MFHKRVVPYPLLQAFDGPDAQQSCGRRDITTVAPQALALLNDPFVRARARATSPTGCSKEAGGDPAGWIERAYQLALGRPPSETERDAGVEFLDAQTRGAAEPRPEGPADEIRRQALADFCQALFGLNEFLYVD